MSPKPPDLVSCIRRLQKTCALLVAVQFAANHDVEFDVSDALAVIVTLVDETLYELDLLEVSQQADRA